MLCHKLKEDAMTTKTYTVVEGDTLFQIAERFYGDGSLFTLVIAANQLSDPDVLTVGPVLSIPERDQHAG
jgi:nucleoid-associated protein YgaU